MVGMYPNSSLFFMLHNSTGITEMFSIEIEIKVETQFQSIVAMLNVPPRD